MAKMYPLVEAIDGRRWTVEDGHARVDLRARKLWAPLADTPTARFLRAHEQGHVKITPAVASGKAAAKAGVSFEALQVCEDRRVHRFLERRGIDRPGALTDADAAAIFGGDRKPTDREFGAMLVATDGTDDYGRVRAAAEDAGEGERLAWIAAAARKVCREVCRGRTGRGRHPTDCPAGFRSRTIPAARLFDTLFPEDVAGAEMGTGEGLAVLAHQAGIGNGNRWGRVDRVERAGMSAGRRAADWVGGRARDEGTAPVAVHRLTTDGRIFRRQLRAPGGTVLIDVSGSMHLAGHDVARILHAAPAARVAVYSGEGEGGRIAIVADRGRMSTAAEIAELDMPGGNIVDGPALQWLAREAAPRLWICDGIVTGEWDITDAGLAAEALRICRGGGIRRVGSPAEAVAALERIHGRRGG